MKIYKAIIQWKLDYGCIIYDDAREIILNSPDSILNAAIRLSLGTYRSSYISSLLAEAGEIPLRHRRELLRMIYACNISTVPDNTACQKISQTRLRKLYKKKENPRKPSNKRITEYSEEFNIPGPEACKNILPGIPPWHQNDTQAKIQTQQPQTVLQWWIPKRRKNSICQSPRLINSYIQEHLPFNSASSHARPMPFNKHLK